MSNQGRHRNSTDSTYMICFNNLEYIPYHDTHIIVKSQIISFQFLYLKNTSTMVISCQSLNTILLGASVLINSKIFY